MAKSRGITEQKEIPHSLREGNGNHLCVIDICFLLLLVRLNMECLVSPFLTLRQMAPTEAQEGGITAMLTGKVTAYFSQL